MLVQSLNNSVLSFALYASFSTTMQWLSLVASTDVYNKTTKVVTFQISSTKTKKLTKKQFTQILLLPSSGNFSEVSTDQVIYMFNEMGHQPTLTNISHFKKLSLPCVLSLRFRIVLRCLIGRSIGLDKAKLEVYLVVAGIYYGLNVDYASMLWEEFGTSISHSKLATGVSSARFWGLIMKEIYSREDILIPSDVDTAEFPSMIVPKIAMNDATIFPVVSRIPNSMLKLMDPKNSLFLKYFLSIDSTQTVVLPLKVS